MRPDDDWIKLEDDEHPIDEHDSWCEGFLILMAVLSVVLILGSMGGWRWSL